MGRCYASSRRRTSRVVWGNPTHAVNAAMRFHVRTRVICRTSLLRWIPGLKRESPSIFLGKLIGITVAHSGFPAAILLGAHSVPLILMILQAPSGGIVP